MRNRIARIERAVGKNKLFIRQQDGSVKQFPQEDFLRAWAIAVQRMCGEDVEEHPMSTAARNSPDSEWSRNFIAIAHTLGANKEGAGEK